MAGQADEPNSALCAVHLDGLGPALARSRGIDVRRVRDEAGYRASGMKIADPGLATEVEDYIEVLDGVLARVVDELPGAPIEDLTHEIAVEAFNLAAAFIDCDGIQTDVEIASFVEAFAGRFPLQLKAKSVDDVRLAGTLRNAAEWLTKPSVLLEILVAMDAKQGTGYAMVYYDRAMHLAHVVISLDVMTSARELASIERFRSLLLRTIEGAGVVARPGPGANVAAEGDRPKDAAAAPSEPDTPARPVEELLAELDALIGLADVKREIGRVADLLQVHKLRSERGLPVPTASRHLVFTGNPGTGKTTVGRLVAEIYRSLGVVERGQLVETDRGGLVAGFVGQTAPKVEEAFDRADGGLLLIDEAYSLVRGGQKDFGREAIDAIVKLMEDRRDRVVVIAAGYPDEMGDFLDANPGLRSRFPKTIHFPDYDTDELFAIFELISGGQEYETGDEAAEAIKAWFTAQPRDKGFGNGRLARNLFDEIVARQASRIVAIEEPSDEELVTFLAGDVPGPEHRLH